MICRTTAPTPRTRAISAPICHSLLLPALICCSAAYWTPALTSRAAMMMLPSSMDGGM